VAPSILLIYSAFRLSLDLSAVRTSPVPPNPTHSHEARRAAFPDSSFSPGRTVDTDRTYSHILTQASSGGKCPNALRALSRSAPRLCARRWFNTPGKAVNIA